MHTVTDRAETPHVYPPRLAAGRRALDGIPGGIATGGPGVRASLKAERPHACDEGFCDVPATDGHLLIARSSKGIGRAFQLVSQEEVGYWKSNTTLWPESS